MIGGFGKQPTDYLVVGSSFHGVLRRLGLVDVVKLQNELLIPPEHISEVVLDQRVVSPYNRKLVVMSLTSVAPAPPTEPPLQVNNRANLRQNNRLGRIYGHNLFHLRNRVRFRRSLLGFLIVLWRRRRKDCLIDRLDKMPHLINKI